MKKQHGFSIIELGIIVVVVAALGVAGYTVYHRSTAKPAAAPPKIQSKPDLKTAAKSLDAQNVNNGLDPTQLDNDVKSLL